MAGTNFGGGWGGDGFSREGEWCGCRWYQVSVGTHMSPLSCYRLIFTLQIDDSYLIIIFNIQDQVSQSWGFGDCITQGTGPWCSGLFGTINQDRSNRWAQNGASTKLGLLQQFLVNLQYVIHTEFMNVNMVKFQALMIWTASISL